MKRLWYAAYGLGVVIIAYCWWHGTGHTTSTAADSIELAVGNLTGLVGTYAVLWQLVLLGRLNILEDAFGLERLTWLHKWNGYLALALILLHALFLTLAFAAADRTGLIAQFVSFLTTWPDLLNATVGTVLLIVIVFISIGIVRRGFKYETWYYVHLLTYLAVLLAFGHQLSDGLDFGHQWFFVLFWRYIYVLAFGALIYFRFLVPAWMVWYYRFRVDRVVAATPSATSVYITGRHLEKFRYRPGQFVIWRFLDTTRWWQAHPFSLSLAPNGRYLRLTAKAAGDFTKQLPGLRPGTLVSVDGPHGNFTLARTRARKLLLIAGGIGITPIRSMVEGLPAGTDAVIIHAARTRADFAFTDELAKLTARPGLSLKYITSDEIVPGLTHGLLTAANLRALVPDAPQREVMLCGPVPMMDSVSASLIKLGLPRERIHTERFAY